MHTTLRDAMQLMRAGDLMAATAEIQRGLGGASPAAPVPGGGRPPIDADFRVIDAVDAPERPHAETRAESGVEPRFIDGRFACAAGARRYKLFIPSRYRGQPLPLVVMLHGCTQAPDDFARGTRMNSLGEAEGCFVLYPAQSQDANPSRCWNWFQPAHQSREGGEPAIVAGLVRELAATYGLDRERIYVAGMSAGGAMAVVLGQAYPDLFAAVGAHSGIPYRAAHDMPSALAAMHARGDRGPLAARSADAPSPVPTIAFHGDRDTTVSPANGERIVAAFAATPASSAGGTEGGRTYTRTVHTDAQQRVVAEHWVVHGAGHAWSGGDAHGSFTDAGGPDASREMLRFFLERRRSGGVPGGQPQ